MEAEAGSSQLPFGTVVVVVVVLERCGCCCGYLSITDAQKGRRGVME